MLSFILCQLYNQITSSVSRLVLGMSTATVIVFFVVSLFSGRQTNCQQVKVHFVNAECRWNNLSKII